MVNLGESKIKDFSQGFDGKCVWRGFQNFKSLRNQRLKMEISEISEAKDFEIEDFEIEDFGTKDNKFNNFLSKTSN